jgi:ornithine cyclodeaminase/alanine dehydrogenase-like protein (mu-crystallin family)
MNHKPADLPQPSRRPDLAASTVLWLTNQDVRALLPLDACCAAVKRAFELHGRGEAAPPAVLSVHRATGTFHVKAGALDLDRPYFAAKANANFPSNPSRHGLAAIQGLIVLADADCGTPLALMDSAEITALRTAAATSVAAASLARAESRTALIIGCGTQGRTHLRALRLAWRLTRVYAWDRDSDIARRFALEASSAQDLDVRVASDFRAACRESDIIVTCTPSHTPVLVLDDVGPGTFVAGVGADNPEKHEIAPALMAASRIVVDVLEQAATLGDLHHAITAGVVSPEDAVELGTVLTGGAPGRRRADEIVVFDSTGMALQDVAAAAAVYERARQTGRGQVMELGG